MLRRQAAAPVRRYHMSVRAYSWLVLIGVALAIVSVWALTCDVAASPAADRAPMPCGSALELSEEMTALRGGGSSAVLVSEDVHRQIEACQRARGRQQDIGIAAGGAAIASVVVAGGMWRQCSARSA
jgi:hypothetical protein